MSLLAFKTKCFQCEQEVQATINLRNGDEAMRCACGANEIVEFGFGRTRFFNEEVEAADASCV